MQTSLRPNVSTGEEEATAAFWHTSHLIWKKNKKHSPKTLCRRDIRNLSRLKWLWSLADWQQKQFKWFNYETKCNFSQKTTKRQCCRPDERWSSHRPLKPRPETLSDLLMCAVSSSHSGHPSFQAVCKHAVFLCCIQPPPLLPPNPHHSPPPAFQLPSSPVNQRASQSPRRPSVQKSEHL